MSTTNENLILIEQLKKLSQDADFLRLQDMLGGAKFLKFCGMEKQETKHSNVLLNLFDTKGLHGWRGDFARELFENELNLKLPANFFAELKTGKREYKFNKNRSRIDLLLYSNDTVVLIENKVDALLHDDQLYNYEEGVRVDKKFKGYKPYYVFLTPDGREPEDGSINWHGASYGQVINAIKRVQKTHVAKTLDEQEINILINHYIKFLRGEVIMGVKNMDDELKSVYESLNNKYPDAVNFIAKQRLDIRLVSIYEEISKILTNEAPKYGLVLKNGNGIVRAGGRIQFKTETMTKQLLKKHTVDENPIIYEISADSGKKIKAYAYARGVNSTDSDVMDVLKACDDYEIGHGRKIKKSKNGEHHRLEFNLGIDIETAYEELQTNSLSLRDQVLELLNEIQVAEAELAKIIVK